MRTLNSLPVSVSVLLAAAALTVMPAPLAAQNWDLVGRDGRVTCESENGARRVCRIDNLQVNTVRLARKLSTHACVNGRSWGTGRDHIWVDNGCRATFTYETGRDGSGGDNDRQSVTCESSGRELKNCGIRDLNERSVRLERRLSQAACVNGRTWGTQPNLIWVESGCRAVFSYTTGRGGNDGGNNGRQQVRCEASGRELKNCRIRNLNERSVRLERRLSEAACINGRTWGTQPNLIWVESGCRAVFTYTTGRGGNDNGNDGSRQQVRCEANGRELKNCRIRNLDERSVRLERRLSQAACVNGRTWGTQPNLIWVESGCRAVFSYRTR